MIILIKMNNVKATEEFNSLTLLDKKRAFRSYMYNVVRHLEKHSVVFGTPKAEPYKYRVRINGPSVNINETRTG